MGKHILEIQFDYNFLLIGISSHEKDYRLCWALNNKFGIELEKIDSLEIKGKKQATPSFFSLFTVEQVDRFIEYTVVANLSESKTTLKNEHSLFGSKREPHSYNENEYLIPEHKQLDYFFVIKGEIEQVQLQQIVKQIKEIDVVLTALPIEVLLLKSKHNLIF